MKDFLKMFFASFTSLVVYGVFCLILTFACLGGMIALFDEGHTLPKVPSKAVLTIDMSKITISEQTREVALLDAIQGVEAPQPQFLL